MGVAVSRLRKGLSVAEAIGIILVVDDSASHRTVISTEIQKLGYAVKNAESGAVALQIINNQEVDLVLLDVNMPGLDGFATLRQLRTIRKELPVIMLTARDDAEDVIQALRLGANDYAVKPITLDILGARIATHLKLNKAANEQLGQYLLLEKIGEGAMGMVFKAEHVDTGDIAAVKVLPRAVTIQEDAVKRFIQEAHLIEKINHPNVVRHFDVGKDGETHFLVMEYVEGETLEKLVAGMPMVPTLAIEIGKQICLGLENMFEQGVIHRDIKPQNILFSDSGEVKIADFGIARDVSNDNRLTQEGIGLGSLVYSSPEQISGKGDFRSDMYSLGCTLFELLAGQMPFPKDKPLEWMLERKFTKPPRITDVYPGLPKGVADFVAKLMDPNADKRFKDYHELLRVIEKMLENLNSPGKSLLEQWVAKIRGH